jgi:hypothetical protein
MASAAAALRSNFGYTQNGCTSWLVEWMSRMWSAAATTGAVRARAAQLGAVLGAVEPGVATRCG